MQVPITHSSQSKNIDSSSNKKLSNGFEISFDGTYANKIIEVDVDGEKQNINCKIYFLKQYGSQKYREEFLNKFTDEKLQVLGKESIALGLGKKYQSLNFSYDFSNQIKKLDMTRFDGTIKTLNMDYFKNKEIEIKKLNDPNKTKKFEKKLSMYKSMGKIIESIKPFEKLAKKKIDSQLEELERQRDEIKEQFKDYYIGDKRVLDIWEEYFESHKNATKEELLKFIENIFSHPDLCKRE